MPLFFRLAWSLTIACMASAAFADASSERSLRMHCSDSNFSQAEVTACLEQAARLSAHTLQQAEQRLDQALLHWEQEAIHIREARAQLVRSQTAFAHYREQHCKLFSGIGGGAAGNTRKLRYLACTAELNQRRMAQLLDTIADLPQR